MITEKWEQIKDRFEQALELSPEGRQSFLADLTREDPTMASEVAQLLQAHEEAGDFLLQPCCLESDFLEDLDLEQHRFSPGEVLCGRFRIVHLIGRGGMGEVYKAWDEELEDHVALKTLRLEISKHELFTSRFRREIQLARKVTHPNVCRIFDSFKHPTSDGTYLSVLSMELLPGQTLAEYLKAKERLTAAEALPLVRQIITGLSAIHAAGIVHRDLKPSNLVLVPHDAPSEATFANFQIKITDFGIAGRLPDGLSPADQTEVSKLMGTPDYMAPEQLEHARANLQSDIYSLGLILYEMVTGVKPFAGTSAWRRTTADPPPPRKLSAALPENWNKTIACCLERNPQYRFQTAQAALDSLESDASAAKIPPKPLLVRLKHVARARRGLIAIIFLLAMALTAGLYRYYHQSPEIPSGTMVLVTEIAVPDPQLSGITVALKSQLAQSAHFDVEEDSKIVDVLKQMDRNPVEPIDTRTAREVALRSGATMVVFGSISKKGEDYDLEVTAEHPFAPNFPGPHWSSHFTATGPSELLGTALHSASTWIRRLAGEQAAEFALHDSPVEDTTTSSWIALQQYNQAEKKAASGDFPDALILLDEAIQADPAFAKARMRRADIWISQGKYNEGYAEWRAAINLAMTKKLTNRESLRIEGQYFEDTGDYVNAERKYAEFKTNYPNDYRAWFYWGSALEASNRKDEAIVAFEKAAQLNPGAYAPHEHLAALKLNNADLDSAKQEIEKVRMLGSSEWATWLTGTTAFVQGRYLEATDIMRTLHLSHSFEWQSNAFLYTAIMLAEKGRRDEAIHELEEGSVFDSEHNLQENLADKKMAYAYLLYRKAMCGAAFKFAEESVALGNTPLHLSKAGILFARCGFQSAARNSLRQLQLQPELWKTRLCRLRLQAEIELSRGSFVAAVRDIRKLAASAPPAEIQEYLLHGLAVSGTPSAKKAYLRTLKDQLGSFLLSSDEYWPGLWADTFQDLLISDAGSDSFCQYAHTYVTLRMSSDPAVNSKFSSTYHLKCGAQAN